MHMKNSLRLLVYVVLCSCVFSACSLSPARYGTRPALGFTDDRTSLGQNNTGTSKGASVRTHPQQVSPTADKATKEGIPSAAQIAAMSTEELEGYMQEKSKQWFFGSGIGKTASNVGIVAAFPPYVFYLLGNAGLQLIGYQSVSVSDAMPEPVRSSALVVYDGVVSVPGMLNAFIFDEHFRDKDHIAKEAEVSP